MLNKSRSAAWNFIAFFILGLVLAGAVWAFLNRQYAQDVITNWASQPASSMVAVADRAKFTDKGKFVLYATKPEVLEKEQFNQACPRQEAGSPILGCYTADDRVFVYNVADERLDGMKEVTAAHELLHAVWYRTSEPEKERLTKILKDEYKKVSNVSLSQRMDYYERTEPTEITNELHSILGTEVKGLSAELEKYYAQFYDRATVLKLHDSYNDVYTGLTSRATELDAEMQKLGAQIEQLRTTYDADLASYTADVASFNQRAAAGVYASTAQFNSERAALIARVNQLEAARQKVNDTITTYNQHYEEYRTIGAQLEIFNDSMDSYHQIEKDPSL